MAENMIPTFLLIALLFLPFAAIIGGQKSNKVTRPAKILFFFSVAVIAFCFVGFIASTIWWVWS